MIFYWTYLFNFGKLRNTDTNIDADTNTNTKSTTARIKAGAASAAFVNTLRPRQNECHFADDIFKCIFLNKNCSIPIKNSLKFVPKGPINYIPALVQIMAWRRPGDRPLSEAMMVSLPTHICVTRPRWVNSEINSITDDNKKGAKNNNNECILLRLSRSTKRYSSHARMTTPIVWWMGYLRVSSRNPGMYKLALFLIWGNMIE